MSNKLVSQLNSMVQRDPRYSVRGPVLQSFRFVERFEQHMYVLEFECAHGTTIPAEYGYFVETEASNTNKTRCTIFVSCEVDENDDPVFTNRVSYEANINEYICKARVEKRIVPKGTDCVEGADVWESSVRYFDEAHDEIETVYVEEQEDVLATEFDGVLNAENPVTYCLTKTQPTPGLSGNVFTSYRIIRCGWYIAKKETIASPGYSYCATENYYWPPVLETDITPSGIDFGELIGERGGVEYTASVLLDYRLKEAYNGPTKVDVVVAFVAAPGAACDLVEYMQPDSINYQGIFVNVRVPECLHPDITFNEVVGSNHPVLQANQVRNKTFPGTTFEDWPNTILGSVQVRPHKGGFVVITKTYHKPTP